MRSTFDGVVTRVWRGAGALVDGTAATPIVQLAASMLAEFDADATERQLVGHRDGQAATRRARHGRRRRSPGRSAPARRALDPATGLGFVRIATRRRRRPCRSAPSARRRCTTGKRDGVLVVPAAALRGAVADGAEVVVCKDGKAERAHRRRSAGATTTGSRSSTASADGERVAVDHVLGLETDAPIVEAKAK